MLQLIAYAFLSALAIASVMALNNSLAPLLVASVQTAREKDTQSAWAQALWCMLGVAGAQTLGAVGLLSALVSGEMLPGGNFAMVLGIGLAILTLVNTYRTFSKAVDLCRPLPVNQ